MSAEENKELVRRFLDDWNNQNWEAIENHLGENYVDHAAPPGAPPGKEGVVPGLKQFTSAFPDLHWTVDQMVAEGDTVVTRSTFSGTHKGELFGIPPTGRQVKVASFDISRFENGKEVEHWGIFDQLGMMIQLGVVPPPGASS